MYCMKEKVESSSISMFATDSSETNVCFTMSTKYAFTAGMWRMRWRIVLFPAVTASRTAIAPMVVLEKTGGRKNRVWSDVNACCKYSPEGVSFNTEASPSLPTRRASFSSPETVWNRKATSLVGSVEKRRRHAYAF